MSESATPFLCPVERNADRAVMRPEGDIDLGSAPTLKELGGELVEQGVRFLAVDLRKVSFMDSSGLGALVVVLKRIRDKDGKLCLFNSNNQIRSLLSMTGLEAVFHLETDENAASRYFDESRTGAQAPAVNHK